VPLPVGILLAASVAVDLPPLGPLEGARLDAERLHGHLLVRLAEAGYGVRSASSPANYRVQLRMAAGDHASLRAVGAQVREADVELAAVPPPVLHLEIVQRALLLLDQLPPETMPADDLPTVFVYFPTHAGDGSAVRSYERAAIALVERGFELVGTAADADRLACISPAGEPVWIAAGEAAARCESPGAPPLGKPRPGEGGPRIDSPSVPAGSSPAPGVRGPPPVGASRLHELVAEVPRWWQAQSEGAGAGTSAGAGAGALAAGAGATGAGAAVAAGDRPALSPSQATVHEESHAAPAKSLWELGASTGVALRDGAVDPIVEILLRRGRETGLTASATARATRSTRDGIDALELSATMGPGWRVVAGSLRLEASLQAGVLAYQRGRWGDESAPIWDWMLIAPLDISWRITPSVRVLVSAAYGLVGHDRTDRIGLDRDPTWSREHIALEAGLTFDF